MSSPPITSKEFGRRFRKALSVPFLLDQVCSSNVQEFVRPYAASLGCSEKCLFFPLLSCVASCLGTECRVQLTTLWSEPPVVWTLVLCQRSLQRVDVAEHLKQQVLRAQDKALVLGRDEDTKEYLKKFVFDAFTPDRLQDALKLSHGHGLALYNSPRPLRPALAQPEHADAMQRMHDGLAWFTDSRVTRMTLAKTRVNFAVLSTPSAAQLELAASPHFHELFHQCFLVSCAEELHAKFSQLADAPADQEKLQEVFVSLLKLHGREPLVYRLGEEARDKFAQIHDELTDKAKQMARKSPHKVFQPALAYLVRLSLALHVLDGVLDALNYKVPLSRLTWSTEISAATVWQARELLGHTIEQRHALMEPTTLVEQQAATPHHQQTIAASPVTPTPMGRSPIQGYSPRPAFSFNNARRNILSPMRGRAAATRVNGASSVTPIIASVSSAGVPVPLGLPAALSVSSVSEAVPEAGAPLLSRPPFASVLDVPQADFLASHRGSVRRLLRHSASEVTPSRCVQLRLAPDPTASDEALRHTQGFARSFLKRLEGLGFGLCDGPKNGNLRNFVFKKKKFSALGDEQRRILDEVKVSEVEYNKCFTAAKEQNGSVVCLE